MRERKHKDAIREMESDILHFLAGFENGMGVRKWYIAEQTGIPEEVVTVLLKRLKLAGKVELICLFSEDTGRPDGSGYCIKGALKNEFDDAWAIELNQILSQKP